MMKNLPRTLKWLIAIVIGVVCLIGFLIGAFWLAFYLRFFVSPGSGGFILRAMLFGGISFCLALSYIYVIKRSKNKSRIRQVYAIIGVFVLSFYVFSEYQTRQEEAAIRYLCDYFNHARAQEDYEIAYVFMSPDYRQTHSPTEFRNIWGKGFRSVCNPYMSIEIFHPITRKATIHHGGTWRSMHFLEKAGGEWYFTGETRVEAR